jgi:hypothetical protein
MDNPICAFVMFGFARQCNALCGCSPVAPPPPPPPGAVSLKQRQFVTKRNPDGAGSASRIADAQDGYAAVAARETAVSRRYGIYWQGEGKNMQSPKRLIICGLAALVVVSPVAAVAQIENSYKPLVTSPPGPQDPAHFNMGNPGAPAITPPAFSNSNQSALPSNGGSLTTVPSPPPMPFPPPGTSGGFQSTAPK